MKRKILILVNHDIVIYNFRRELVEKLNNENFDVIISSPYGKRIDKLMKLGSKFIDTKISNHGKNPFEDLKLIKFYKKIIKQEKPDVVLGFTIKPNIYGSIAAKSFKVPFIANITGLGTAIQNYGLIEKIIILLYKYSFKNVNMVFFQNIQDMNYFHTNNIVLNRKKLLPGSGVNLQHFNVLDYPQENNIEFLFLSRIMRDKGIDLYLETAKKVKEIYPNIIFHICGSCDTSYRKIIEEYHENKTIVYHGMIDDVRTILKRIHCLIHPSYHEGMANVILESAASGRPVIVSNINGCKEAVVENVTGYTFKTKDIDDLVDKVIKFIELPYEQKRQMGLAGREKMENEFDRKIVVNAYLDEIHKILGGKK